MDLVLLSVKSESRSRIWYWSGIILSPGFGTGLNLSFCAHWFMFDINATLVVYLQMFGAEFKYELVFLVSVSDLVLFPIKSGSRSRI